MRQTKLPSDRGLPGDSEAMRSALATLREMGIPFVRRTRYQLKINEWNFYPDRGTIVCDGAEGAEDERGLGHLLARLGRRVAASPSDAQAPPMGEKSFNQITPPDVIVFPFDSRCKSPKTA